MRFLAIGSTSPELRLQKAGSLLFDDPSRYHSVQTEDGLISNTIPARMAYSYMSALGFELGDTNEEDPYEFLDGVDYRSIPELMKKAGIVPRRQYETRWYGKIKSHIRLLKIYNIKGGKLFPPFIFLVYLNQKQYNICK